MPKKRNTRKHKISIDQKRQVVPETSSSSVVSSSVATQKSQQPDVSSGMTFSLPTNLVKAPTTKNPVVTTVISTENYGYLTTDLLKTAIISGAVVIVELLIKTFFRA